jgi:ATP-dependent 26S proteasome regulatory subunit
VVQPGVDGVHRLLDIYSNRFNHDFVSDKRKLEKIVQLLSQKTPSDIRTIVTNAITQAIIQGRDIITVDDLLIENFQFDKHGSFTSDELIKYLNDNGVPQLQIADLLNMSIRQIRNNLKEN